MRWAGHVAPGTEPEGPPPGVESEPGFDRHVVFEAELEWWDFQAQGDTPGVMKADDMQGAEPRRVVIFVLEIPSEESIAGVVANPLGVGVDVGGHHEVVTSIW
jgi:hypothetical protein